MFRIITRKNIHQEANGESWIGVIPNKRVDSGNYFVTLIPLHVELQDGTVITIPKGFSFDGSSVPRWLEVVFRRYGPFLFAAMIHDWLYVTDYRRDILGDKEAQRFADEEMLLWSDATNFHSNWSLLDNWLRYKAVRWFGRKVYKR